MRVSKLLLRTLREAPSDAEAVSHQLLVRAGYIRRVASGVYSFLPLGHRTMRRVTEIVRREMDNAGAQELLLPALAPVELFEETGRNASMDDVLMRVENKGGHFVLGPTHEEVVTNTVLGEVDSYKGLPLNVYQFQTKFRDEARPRYGLLRTREFIMKDAYSFDVSADAMRDAYKLMYDAYCSIFNTCGLTYFPVEASSGAIGGDVNHEFMVPSEIGEDYFVQCKSCGYQANTEAAKAGSPASANDPKPEHAHVVHFTPDCPGIDLLVEHFNTIPEFAGLTAAETLKCLALIDESKAKNDPARVVLALVPGDREVLVDRVGATVRPFDLADFADYPDLIKGYIGPQGQTAKGYRVVGDLTLQAAATWVSGANQDQHHATGVTVGRDFEVSEWASIGTLKVDDPCSRCGSGIDLVRSVEAGHTFQLGLTYSQKISGANFVDEDGVEKPYWMGCYGIGISRLMAVVAEEHHDGNGLAWPEAIAPYQVSLVSLATKRTPEIAEAAEKIYQDLLAAGIEVLFDDREVAAGVKFADADLLGMPIQILVGGKGLARGVVERKFRRTGERDEIALEDLIKSFA